MRKLITVALLAIVAMAASAQKEGPFKARVVNDEYKIYLCMDFYDKQITVPGMDVVGKVDGFIGSTQSRNKWIIVSSEIKKGNVAEIELVNDYGSEDLTATITLEKDGTYTYRKKDGSTLKFAVNGKWQKLPGTIELKK